MEKKVREAHALAVELASAAPTDCWREVYSSVFYEMMNGKQPKAGQRSPKKVAKKGGR